MDQRLRTEFQRAVQSAIADGTDRKLAASMVLHGMLDGAMHDDAFGAIKAYVVMEATRHPAACADLLACLLELRIPAPVAKEIKTVKAVVVDEAKVHEFRKAGTPGIDVALHSMRTTRDVYWSPSWTAPPSHGGRGGGNSYVLVKAREGERDRHCFLTPAGTRVQLASVNGAGEVRWYVDPYRIKDALENEARMEALPAWDRGDSHEWLGAFKHFNLALTKE